MDRLTVPSDVSMVRPGKFKSSKGYGVRSSENPFKVYSYIKTNWVDAEGDDYYDELPEKWKEF